MKLKKQYFIYFLHPKSLAEVVEFDC